MNARKFNGPFATAFATMAATGTLLLLAVGPALASQSIEQRAPASARGTVEVANVAGKVTVRGTKRAEVHVAGEIGPKSRLEFSVNGERTVIKVVLPHGSTHDETADLDIEIPADSALTVSTVSADSVVTEVTGALDLQSVSGNIQTDAFDKDLKLRTVSGDVDVRGHRGGASLSAVTVSGNVGVKSTGGEVNASSVSGDLNLRLTTVTRSRLRTTSGDITLHAGLAKDARVDTESVSGDLSFTLGGPRDAEYDLATASGDISKCFGPEVVSHEYGPGRELKFREGAGSAGLRARSLSGDISLCQE
jgi:hypothetical protein